MSNCAIQGCRKQADVEVILYDLYSTGEVFFNQDITCPYLCTEHVVANEAGAFSQIGRSELSVTLSQIADSYEAGVRSMDMAISHSVGRPIEMSEVLEDTIGRNKIPPLRDHRGGPHYPFTNRERAQGFTIYRPLDR